MAAWSDHDDDFGYDRLEARGEAAALDGIDSTEAFYPEWGGPLPEPSMLHTLLTEPIERVIALLEGRAA